VDAAGKPYVTGYFKSPTITFGSFTLTNTGSEDLFLVKYDASGNVLWAKSAIGTESDYGFSVAVDAAGNPYLGGVFGSPTINFGSITLTNTSGGDMFLVKYDTGGNALWAKCTGGPAIAVAMSIAVDASGNPYVAGEFGSPTINFGSTTLTSAGSYDMFLAKLESSGVGINELSNPLNISVFPNPAIDIITLEIPGETEESNLSVINIEGQEIITLLVTESKIIINIKDLPGGVYFVRLMGEKKVQVGKFVKW
jgi:hypothetical protein